MKDLNRLTPLAWLLLLLAAPTVLGQNNTVVSGKSVGNIQLGETRAQTHGRLGSPSESVVWRNGLRQDTWLGPEPPNDQYGLPASERVFVRIIFRNGKAVQIEFNSPALKTADGVSVRSSLGQFRAKHRGLKVSAYGYEDYIGYYYDDVRLGLAFSVGVQDNFDASVTPSSLIVHLPGQPVIPERNGRPVKPNDEVPVFPRQP